MASNKTELDPNVLKAWIADARKKPISFAMLIGKDGIVMQADKIKSPEQMRKVAKSAGGGSKGCWGKMEVQQKKLHLVYEGKPPGGFDKQVRKMLSQAGQPLQVVMQSAEDLASATTAPSDTPPDERKPRPKEPSEDSVAGEDQTKTEDDEDIVDLGNMIQIARKRPLNFACMLAESGVVLVTHRLKQSGILVKQAKGAGGSAKGGWGTLTVEGKVVVLNCLEDPPGTLARRLKLHLRANGQKFAVKILSPSGEFFETEEDEAPASSPGSSDQQVSTEATTPQPQNDQTDPEPATPRSQINTFIDTFGPTFSQDEWREIATSLEAIKTIADSGDHAAAQAALEDLAATTAHRSGSEKPPEPLLTIGQELARAENAVRAVQSQMTEKQRMMFDKLLTTARNLYSANTSKASATLKLVMQKLDALDLEPSDSVILPPQPPAMPDPIGDFIGLVSDERKAEIDAWIDKFGEYDNAWQLGDDEGGEYLAEALRGDNDEIGELDATEKAYLAVKTTELWRDKDGQENRSEARWEIGRDPDARRALALGFISHKADTVRTLQNHPVIMSIEGADADSWMFNEAVSLDPKAAIDAFQGMEGELGRLAAGPNNLFAMKRQQGLLDVVNRGDVSGPGADKLVTSIFLSTSEGEIRNIDYRETMATALSKIANPDPDDQENSANRLKGLFDESDVREMLFSKDITPELRNWALAQAANNPEWSAENMAEGWESEFISQKMAAPIVAKYESRGLEPHLLKTGKDDRMALRNSIGQVLSIPPDKLPPEDETPQQRLEREKNGLDHSYYGPNKQIDKIADLIANETPSPAKMTVIPVVVSSNEFGVANFSVFRLEQSDGTARFVDNIGERFDDFKDWHSSNKLPPGKMTYPEGLVLGAKMVTENTPLVKDTFSEWLLVVGDAVALTAGIAVGVIAIAGTGGLSTPLVLTAAGAAGWQVGRAGGRLADDHAHGHDITDFSDPNVRANWLDVGAGVLSIGALGAVAKTATVAGSATRVGTTAARTTAGLQMASNTADALAMGNQAHMMHQNWDKMSAGDKAMGMLNIAFWGGMSAASTKAGGAYLRDATSFTKLSNQAEFGSVYKVETNPDLAPSQIRTAYDPGAPGDAPSNIRIETGGGDIDPKILDLHTNVGRQMEMVGRMKAKVDGALKGKPAPEPGTAAWEAKLEIDKIAAESELLRLKLEARGTALNSKEIAEIQIRQKELAIEAEFQQARVNDYAKAGEGWVAQPGKGHEYAVENGLPVGDEIPGHAWVLRGDPPPHLRKIDPDAQRLKWDETSQKVVEVDDTPIDIDALIAEARAKVANTDAPPDTTMTTQQGKETIDTFRENNSVTDSHGGEGTVAATKIGDETIVGVNSHNFTDEQRAIVKAWEKKLKIPAGKAGANSRQALYHAEAHTLIQVFMKTNGNPPKNLTIYIDKLACNNCRKFLPKLLKDMGINSLTIIEQKRGSTGAARTAVVTQQRFQPGW